jgi:hypothetical protein
VHRHHLLPEALGSAGGESVGSTPDVSIALAAARRSNARRCCSA